MRTFDSKPASFFAKHVKHLCLDEYVPLADGMRILSACTSVEDLVCWMNTTFTPSDLPLKFPSQPKNLSINPALFIGNSGRLDFGSSMFRFTSHLEVVNISPTPLSDFSSLDLMPNLTHLALAFLDTYGSAEVPRTVNHALSSCKSLKILVLVIPDRSHRLYLHQYDSIDGVDSQDPRILLLPYDFSIWDWKQGAQGKPDFWAVAEHQLLEKAADNVSGLSCYGQAVSQLKQHGAEG
jgi:hypothetical protein